MKKVILKLAKDLQKAYPIFIGVGLAEKISTLVDLSNYSKIFVITDQNIKSILNKLLTVLPIETNFIILSPSEKEKNIINIQKIWSSLINNQYDRKSLIINLGGGVISDLGGFAASTFMRGIDFINIPTTLLSQVDASVGGKTGIDFANIKNLIGTFSQPKAVIIDTNTLTTLPKREFLSGFAEIIKHGAVKDKKYFDLVTSKHPLGFTINELTNIILRSVQIKKDIVESDETEDSMRKVLNFGHTIGHAVESISLETEKPLLHGEAISIGMFIEAKISHIMGLLSQKDLQIIEQSLVNAGLPKSIDNLDKEETIKLMQSDKKNEKGKVNFTLLSGIGKAVINQNPSLSIIREALI